MDVVYKIRRASDGMFSTGGRAPRWAKRGKAWACHGAVKRHFRELADELGRNIRLANPYENCDVVRYRIEPDGETIDAELVLEEQRALSAGSRAAAASGRYGAISAMNEKRKRLLAEHFGK